MLYLRLFGIINCMNASAVRDEQAILNCINSGSAPHLYAIIYCFLTSDPRRYNLVGYDDVSFGKKQPYNIKLCLCRILPISCFTLYK